MKILTQSSQEFLRSHLHWLIGDEVANINFSLVSSSRAEMEARGVDLDTVNLAEGCSSGFIFDGGIYAVFDQCVFPVEADYDGHLAAALKEPIAGIYPFLGRLGRCHPDDIMNAFGEQYRMVVPVILSGEILQSPQLFFKVECIWAQVCDNEAVLGFMISDSFEIPLKSIQAR